MLRLYVCFVAPLCAGSWQSQRGHDRQGYLHWVPVLRKQEVKQGCRGAQIWNIITRDSFSCWLWLQFLYPPMNKNQYHHQELGNVLTIPSAQLPPGWDEQRLFLQDSNKRTVLPRKQKAVRAECTGMDPAPRHSRSWVGRGGVNTTPSPCFAIIPLPTAEMSTQTQKKPFRSCHTEKHDLVMSFCPNSGVLIQCLKK